MRDGPYITEGAFKYPSLRDGLLYWWEPALGSMAGQLLDLGPYANHMTITNATDSISGPNHAIASSSTAQYANTNQALLVSGLSVLTFAFWLNWTTFANNDFTWLQMSLNWPTQVNAFAIYPNTSLNSGFGFFVRDAGGVFRDITFSRPSQGNWHHYVLTADLSSATVLGNAFVDGIQQTLATSSSGTPTPGTFSNQVLYLNGVGSIGTIAIYNRYLLADEVTSLYQNGSSRDAMLLPKTNLDL